MSAALFHVNMRTKIFNSSPKDVPLNKISVSKIWQQIIGSNIDKNVLNYAFSTTSLDDSLLPYKVLEDILMKELIRMKVLSALTPK